MGLMQKLRNNMPGVIIFIAASFILLMVVGDIMQPGSGMLGSGPGGPSDVGNINGVPIDASVYQSRVAEAIEQQRQQNKQNPDADVDEDQIRESVWQQSLVEGLLMETADDLGIYVSDDELREVMLYDPPEVLKQSFTDSTGFQEAAYREFISNPRGYLSNIKGMTEDRITKTVADIVRVQEGVRLERLRQLIETIVSAGAVPSANEALAAYRDQNTKATGSYIVIDALTIADSAVQVSEAEARKYYEGHKGEFVQKASRSLRYVQIPVLPSKSDSEQVSRRLRNVHQALQEATTPQMKDSLFKEFTGTYGAGLYDGTKFVPIKDISPELQAALVGAEPGTVIGPIQLASGSTIIYLKGINDTGEAFVRAQHILLRTGSGINEDSVKAQAEEIARRARAGEAFELLAQQYSADGSAQNGGDLGYFRRTDMVKPFADAAFEAAPGTIVGPVKTEYGYHIIRVNDRSTRSYNLVSLNFDTRISNPTRNIASARARKIRDAIADGKSLDTLARAENLQVLETGPLERLSPAAGSMRLTNFAWSGEAGDVSDVVDLKDGSLVVAQISKVSNPGQMSFEDAKEDIMTKLRTQKKIDMIKPRAEKARAAIGAGDSLAAVARIDSTLQPRSFTSVTQTAPFPGVGYEPALSNAVFNLKINEISPLIRGDRGWYIVQVTARTEPSEADFQKEKEKFIQSLIQQRRTAIYQGWLQSLMMRANVEDNRNL